MPSRATRARTGHRDAPPPLSGDLLDLLVDCSVRAVVAELQERQGRVNPQGETTDEILEACADAGFGDDGRSRPA